MTPTRVIDDGWVVVEDGVISERGHGTPPTVAAVVERPGSLILPGLVDLHVHGGGGWSMTEGDPDAVAQAVASHTTLGTTALLAGIVTSPLDQMATALEAASAAVAHAPGLRGIYLEGPFLAPQRKGAHPEEHLRSPQIEDLVLLQDAARGLLTVIALAPELPGGMSAVSWARAQGILPAVAHTGCSHDEAVEAIHHGARLLTHAFNGMAPMSARDPGPLPAFIAAEETLIELINDGVHVHESLIRMAWRAVGPDRLLFVSDATPSAGLGDGVFWEKDERISVSGGVARVDSGSLAGGATGLASALRRGVIDLGLPLTDMVRMTSTTAARAVGWSDGTGDIVVGTPAALLVVDDALHPLLTVQGEVRHDARDHPAD